MPASDDALVVDRLVHEPGRLAVMTLLSSVSDADFVFLQRATGLTKGNLSSHLSKLEAAGLVDIEKRFVHRKPNTKVSLTQLGRGRIERHWDQLESIRRLAGAPAEEVAAPPAPVPATARSAAATARGGP
jgi:DNA-binding transcriptional ArsR family regulator